MRIKLMLLSSLAFFACEQVAAPVEQSLAKNELCGSSWIFMNSNQDDGSSATGDVYFFDCQSLTLKKGSRFFGLSFYNSQEQYYMEKFADLESEKKYMLYKDLNFEYLSIIDGPRVENLYRYLK